MNYIYKHVYHTYLLTSNSFMFKQLVQMVEYDFISSVLTQVQEVLFHIQSLVKVGADPTIKDCSGLTPADLVDQNSSYRKALLALFRKHSR